MAPTHSLLALLSACALGHAQLPLRPPDAQNHPERPLAEKYCQSCHLFPEPELLDQSTWQNALRSMAPYLGVARLNYKNIPGGEHVEKARIFPINPVVSEAEWRAINNFYIETAPLTAPRQSERPTFKALSALFRPRKLVETAEASMISMVKVHPAARSIIYSQGGSPALVEINSRGEEISRFSLSSAASSIAFSAEGYYLSMIGNLFPSDEQLGQVAFRRKGGELKTLLTDLPRVTDTQIRDLDGDGIDDLVVCVFGHRLGRFSWLKGSKEGTFTEHILFDRPGALRARLHDANHDGRPDIFVAMGQAREGIYAFENKGDGNFQLHEIAQHHPAFGSADLQLADFDGDRQLDLLLTNGDNGEFPSCFKKFHGLRIYLRRTPFHYEEAFFFPLNGAFNAVARDFDKDGDMDLAAVSFFPDLSRSAEDSFVYLENRGGLKFEPYSFPEAIRGRWIVLDAGDADGDGDDDIVLGSFAAGPQSVPVPPAILQEWAREKIGLMFLENLHRK